MSGKGLEALKFAIYIAVPAGLATIIAFPTIRRRILTDLGLKYPTEAERPEAVRRDVQRLRVIAEESQRRKQ